MNHLLFIKNSVRQKDAISGVVTGLGVLAVETAYLVFAIILGINLFKRGTYYQILKRTGEGDKTSSQSANVLGMLEPGENSQNGSGENRQKRVKKKSPMYQKIDENYLLV